MLQEIPAVRQDALPLRRHWFQDDYFDVFLWVAEDQALRTFQLAYRRGGDEGVLEWSCERGFEHSLVDEGEADPRTNVTPLLVAGGSCPVREVAREFSARSEPMRLAWREFILRKLRHARRLRRAYGARRARAPHAH
jgi:hypothetical protein